MQFAVSPTELEELRLLKTAGTFTRFKTFFSGLRRRHSQKEDSSAEVTSLHFMKLHTLDLVGTDLTNIEIGHLLPLFPSITHLNISGSSSIGSKGICSIIDNLRQNQLRNLKLNDISPKSEFSAISILIQKHAQSLEELELASFRDPKKHKLSRRNRHQSMGTTDDSEYSKRKQAEFDEFCFHTMPRLENLKKLNLSTNEFLSDENALEVFAGHRLEEVDFSKTGLTNRFVKALVNGHQFAEKSRASYLNIFSSAKTTCTMTELKSHKKKRGKGLATPRTPEVITTKFIHAPIIKERKLDRLCHLDLGDTLCTDAHLSEFLASFSRACIVLTRCDPKVLDPCFAHRVQLLVSVFPGKII